MARISARGMVLVVAFAWAASAAVADPPLPVPAAESMARSRATVEDVFADDIDDATTPAEKSALARRLAERAAATSDPSDRFALLAMAVDKAIESGDVAVASGLIDRVPREFMLPTEEWRLDATTRLAAKAGPQGAAEVTDLFLAIGRDALESGAEDVVSKASSLALVSARRAKDADRAAQATRLQQRLRKRQAIDKEVRPLLDAVAKDPTDEDANAAAGKTLCLKAERWTEGLPLLAKGGDRDLRAIAMAEMKIGDSPARRLALADAWWEWSESQKPPWKFTGKARAGHHYERVVNSLNGLERARVEKRLATAARAGGGTGQTVWLAELPEKGVAGQVMFSKDGQCFGRPFTVGGKAFPHAITALPKAKSYSRVSYAIPPAAIRCRGAVGIFTPDTAKPGEKPASPVIFQLVVDGDVAWRSPPLRNLDEAVSFDVDLDGGRVLELETCVGDSDWCCWGSWLDPVFVK
ncbi:MAG: NPCBM/NEW2 domain-containing protein [Planctomycetaceae bacterium]